MKSCAVFFGVLKRGWAEFGQSHTLAGLRHSCGLLLLLCQSGGKEYARRTLSGRPFPTPLLADTYIQPSTSDRSGKETGALLPLRRPSSAYPRYFSCRRRSSGFLGEVTPLGQDARLFSLAICRPETNPNPGCLQANALTVINRDSGI